MSAAVPGLALPVPVITACLQLRQPGSHTRIDLLRLCVSRQLRDALAPALAQLADYGITPVLSRLLLTVILSRTETTTGRPFRSCHRHYYSQPPVLTASLSQTQRRSHAGKRIRVTGP